MAESIARDEADIVETMAKFTDLKGGHNYFEAKRTLIISQMKEERAIGRKVAVRLIQKVEASVTESSDIESEPIDIASSYKLNQTSVVEPLVQRHISQLRE